MFLWCHLLFCQRHYYSVFTTALYMEVHTQGRVHQDGVVQLGGGLSDVDRLHLLEAAQRMTLWHQLRDGALVEGARDQQDDIIDHIAVSETQGRWGRVVMTEGRSHLNAL